MTKLEDRFRVIIAVFDPSLIAAGVIADLYKTLVKPMNKLKRPPGNLIQLVTK